MRQIAIDDAVAHIQEKIPLTDRLLSENRPIIKKEGQVVSDKIPALPLPLC